MLQSETRIIIMVSSITYAYMARDILYRKNIMARIERVPANLRKNGCGYGVRIINKSASEISEIAEMLRNSGVKIRDIVEY